jgi:hypothetical protein
LGIRVLILAQIELVYFKFGLVHAIGPHVQTIGVNMRNLAMLENSLSQEHKILSKVESRRNLLIDLKKQLDSNEKILSLKGYFKLTKTENLFSEVFLYRDTDLETSVQQLLEKKASYEMLIQRYNNYDRTVVWNEWPKHYAVRILSGNGSFASGKNIFAFFPEALRLLPKNEYDIFGLEFIDVWENIFKNTVFPCVKKVFDLQSQLEIFTTLEVNLPRTIFLAAVFHEMGHRCGPWKVSPHSHADLKINSYHWGIMGEISTDSLLSCFLAEFPEVALFVTLQRLFWFGRRGISENPISGLTNSDNDSWLGSYLWNKLVKENAVKINENGILTLNSKLLAQTYKSITRDIDLLAVSLVYNTANQDDQIEEWMRSQVSWEPNFGYTIPLDFMNALEKCYEIPEQAHFHTPFYLSDFRRLNQNKCFEK